MINYSNTIFFFFSFYSYGIRGITVDENNYLFVADTLNNAIRMIRPDGRVITIAGLGFNIQGYQDGDCKTATFSLPSDIAVLHKMIDGEDTTILIIADTGNHRIR